MAKEWFYAECQECREKAGGIGREFFSDYEERARWVGAHRIKTGHHVKMFQEAAE